MRVFAVEGPPPRIVAELVEAGLGGWDRERCFTEEGLLDTEEGRAALEAWRSGDDSAFEVGEAADLAISAADDELIAAGRAARPDLRARLGSASSAEEINDALNTLRRVGAEVLGTR